MTLLSDGRNEERFYHADALIMQLILHCSLPDLKKDGFYNSGILS